jgi:amino acid transporter
VWCWLVSVVDAAVYPAMAAEYMDVAAGGALGRVPGGRLAAAQAIVALLTVANLGGMEWILRLEVAFAVVTVVPCLLYIGLGFGLGKADFGLVLGAAAAGSQPVDWAKLLSWVMWLYSGFDSFGSVAGEIEEPQRTIPLAVALLLPVVTAFNTLPFVVAGTCG